ncbi:MAG: CcoQ/FixQ family Cbb3-type cytochrome c oxidase assembly chaperone [Neisseria sp.]|nr:CcoQ/FixQ family Cbb3-type cytochrome c oxidase assembly chaperone [Neisseria sp.]
MDINWVRSLFTVWVFISFILVLYIVLNKRNKKNYDDASRCIVDDDDTPDESALNPNREHGAKE